MNRLQLAQRIQNEINSYSVVSPILTTVLTGMERPQQKQIIAFLDDEYLSLLREQLWDFRKTAGTLFSTVAGTGDYTLSGGVAGVEEFDRNSFKTVKSGQTYHVHLEWMPYDVWLDVYDVVYPQLGNSWPVHVTQLPSQALRLTPKPDDVYDVSANYYAPVTAWSADADEPEWHEDLHEVLVWRVARKMLGEIGVSEALALRVQEQEAEWNQRMRNRYLGN